MINYEAFFRVSYGLYIVSAGDKTVRNGFISNSVFQVTAEPPQFAVCCNKENYSAGIIRNSGFFSISVLDREADPRLIGKFGYKSGKDISKFENVQYKTGESGVPIVLEDTVAWIECELKEIFDVGTHLIFTGEVLHSEVLDVGAEVLTYSYYKDHRKGLAPKNAPTYVAYSKLKN